MQRILSQADRQQLPFPIMNRPGLGERLIQASVMQLQQSEIQVRDREFRIDTTQHPSGVAEPSQANERVTRRLRAALQLVDIRVLDHIIVADNGGLSFARRGLI
jgi:hypothetical protein